MGDLQQHPSRPLPTRKIVTVFVNLFQGTDITNFNDNVHMYGQRRISYLCIKKQLVILLTSCKYWTYEMPERNCYLVRSNQALESSKDKTSGSRGCSKNPNRFIPNNNSENSNSFNVDRCPQIVAPKSGGLEPTDYTLTPTDFTPVTDDYLDNYH